MDMKSQSCNQDPTNHPRRSPLGKKAMAAAVITRNGPISDYKKSVYKNIHNSTKPNDFSENKNSLKAN